MKVHTVAMDHVLCLKSSTAFAASIHLFRHLTYVLPPFAFTDVDECRTGDVCGGNICVNLVGTYRCECRIGFMFNTITTRCEGAVQTHHD